MSFTVVLRPEAQKEFDEAYDWYEQQKPDLGDEFADRVQDIFDSLNANPKIHAKVYQEVRRAVVKKFPYCVYYYVENTEVVVISVFHTKRNPTIWQSRI